MAAQAYGNPAKKSTLMKWISWFDLCNYLILFLLCLSILYPLYHMLIVSLSDGHAVLSGQVSLWPIEPSFKTYKVIFETPLIATSYMNTLVYTFVGTIIGVGMTALCAYPLSRKEFYGRALFNAVVIFTMFFEGGIIPLYLLIDSLGILNSTWAIVLPPAIHVFYMLIMRTFFEQIPKELHESAYTDGANDLTIFFKIILPLSIPVLATMVLFYAVWHWNSFFPALMYLNDQNKYPVQIVMQSIVVAGNLSDVATTGEADLSVIGNNIKYAVIIITILPIVGAYPFIQKYFVKGMMLGSLKG